MTDVSQYSYSTPLSYEPTQQLSYAEPVPETVPEKKPRRKLSPAAKVGIAGAGVGAVAGGILGAIQNPYIRNGCPTDTFAKRAYNKYMELAPADKKEFHTQYNEVISKIDKVKTVDELKTLLNNNPKAAEEIPTALKMPIDEYLKPITDANLSANKAAIKEKLAAGNKTRFQYMKNQISQAWSADKKKFEKPADMDEELFNSIKKVSNRVKTGFIAKWALISAAVVSAVAVIAQKIIKHKKETSMQ